MANTYRAEGARRAAHALIATMGATRAQFQIALPPVADDDGEELGLRTPQFQTESVAPVAIRRVAQRTEVLVPADTLETVFGVEGSGAVATALLTVTTVQIEDELYVATSIEPVTIGNKDCLYRLLLRPQGTEVV